MVKQALHAAAPTREYTRIHREHLLGIGQLVQPLLNLRGLGGILDPGALNACLQFVLVTAENSIWSSCSWRSQATTVP